MAIEHDMTGFAVLHGDKARKADVSIEGLRRSLQQYKSFFSICDHVSSQGGSGGNAVDPAARTLLQTVLETEAPAGLRRRAHGIQRRNKVCRMYVVLYGV